LLDFAPESGALQWRLQLSCSPSPTSAARTQKKEDAAEGEAAASSVTQS
jgi:hypothetical protein